MSAVESRYSVDVVTVGETSLRVEVQRMRRRGDDPRMSLVGVRIAAPHAAAVATRLGPVAVRRLVAALEQAAADAFGSSADGHDDEDDGDADHHDAGGGR